MWKLVKWNDMEWPRRIEGLLPVAPADILAPWWLPRGSKSRRRRLGNLRSLRHGPETLLPIQSKHLCWMMLNMLDVHQTYQTSLPSETVRNLDPTSESLCSSPGPWKKPLAVWAWHGSNLCISMLDLFKMCFFYSFSESPYFSLNCSFESILFPFQGTAGDQTASHCSANLREATGSPGPSKTFQRFYNK